MGPEQVRAARNWLGWTQAELAQRAQIGLSTVKSCEQGNNVTVNNRAAIQRALEAAGIRFGAASVSGPIKSAGDLPAALDKPTSDASH